MADYIEREKVTELIDYHQEEYCEAESYFGLLKEDFQELPSADVAPVKHGRWISIGHKLSRICSVCDCDEPYKFADDDANVYDYCPHCGAKMDLLN